MINVAKKLNKKTLWIFLHIPKTGGNTLVAHIRIHFKIEEVLFLYKRNTGIPRQDVEKYIQSIPDSRRNKIKIIVGHHAYYGIDKYFPNKEVKYFTFLRSPVQQIISRYNFRLMVPMGDRAPLGEGAFERSKQEFYSQGNLLSFEQWYLKNEKDLVLKYFLPLKYFNKLNLKISEKMFEDTKNVLDKFYFVGLTENPEDFYFIYHELGIKSFLPKQNISKQYFKPGQKKYAEIQSLILKSDKYDQKFYEHGKIFNIKFKKSYKNFHQVTKITARIKLNIFLNKALIDIYKIGKKLFGKYLFYSKLVKKIEHFYKKILNAI